MFCFVFFSLKLCAILWHVLFLTYLEHIQFIAERNPQDTNVSQEVFTMIQF